MVENMARNLLPFSRSILWRWTAFRILEVTSLLGMVSVSNLDDFSLCRVMIAFILVPCNLVCMTFFLWVLDLGVPAEMSRNKK